MISNVRDSRKLLVCSNLEDACLCLIPDALIWESIDDMHILAPGRVVFRISQRLCRKQAFHSFTRGKSGSASSQTWALCWGGKIWQQRRKRTKYAQTALSLPATNID